MKDLIIGLVGRQGAGKDIAADIIAKEFKVPHVKFATALKNITEEFCFDTSSREAKEREQYLYVNPDVHFTSIQDAFGKHRYDEAWFRLWEVLEPYRINSRNEWLISPRRFEQLLGTEVGRHLSESIWVDTLLDSIEGSAVVSDVRFLDEAKVCDGLIYLNREGTVGDKSHSSEAFTETVHNFFWAPWELMPGADLDFVRDQYFKYNLLHVENHYTNPDDLVSPLSKCVASIVQRVQQNAGIKN